MPTHATTRRHHHQARAAAQPHAPTPAHRAAAALAVCLTLLGAGCSNATNRTAYTPTWTPPATSSATPTLSPEDAAAKATALAMQPPAPYTPEFTPEGAANAATYFLNLYPYVYATGDLNAWQNMSEDDCEFCNSVISNVTELHDAGGWIDPWEQEITPLGYWADSTDPNRYVIRIQVNSHERNQHPGGSELPLHIEQAEDILLIQLHWSNGEWTVEITDIQDESETE